MTTAAESIKTPTYGNWRRPRKAGLGPLGLVGTVGVFGGLVLVLLASMVSLQAAFVVGVPLVVRCWRRWRSAPRTVATSTAWLRSADRLVAAEGQAGAPVRLGPAVGPARWPVPPARAC